MNLVTGGIRRQCRLALRHVGRLVKAMDKDTQLRDVVQVASFLVLPPPFLFKGLKFSFHESSNFALLLLIFPLLKGICYVTNASYIREARNEWERRTNNAIIEYVVVPELPKSALVEWQVWAHRGNTRFECKYHGIMANWILFLFRSLPWAIQTILVL